MDNLPKIIASLITEDPDLILESDREVKGLEREFLSDPSDEYSLMRLISAYNKIGGYSKNSTINDAIRHIDMIDKEQGEQEKILEYLNKLPDNELPEINVDNVGRSTNDPLTLLVISKNAEYSYIYARHVIRGRWTPGEKVISKDADFCYLYISDVIRGRFPLGEETISKKAEYSYIYARGAIKGRFLLGEEVISKNAQYTYLYIRDIIKGRWPLGEEIISKNAGYSYWYARDIIEGEWAPGEEVISKDAEYSLLYARDVLKSKWWGPFTKQAEESINKDNISSSIYSKLKYL